LPPFTAGIVNAAKAIGAAGSDAMAGGESANSNNPKAKSLLSTDELEDATVKKEANAAFEKAKGDAK